MFLPSFFLNLQCSNLSPGSSSPNDKWKQHEQVCESVHMCVKQGGEGGKVQWALAMLTNAAFQVQGWMKVNWGIQTFPAPPTLESFLDPVAISQTAQEWQDVANAEIP